MITWVLALLAATGAPSGEYTVLPGPDGHVAPNAAIVLLGRRATPPTATVEAAGNPLPARTEVWRALDGAASHLLVIHPATPWPAGKTLTVRLEPDHAYEVRIAKAHDATPPSVGALGRPAPSTRGRKGRNARPVLAIPTALADAGSAAVHVTLVLKDEAGARTEAEGYVHTPATAVTLTGADIRCVTSGTATDPAGNQTAVPPSSCPF